jgi:HAD superfamily hydrolase (TIGR01490 family)
MNRPEQGNGRVAAFFDVDGTLMGRPSLEWRFFADLRYRRAIPLGNFWFWLARAVRLAPRGILAVQHANKMYLRGVRAAPVARDGEGFPRMSAPRFFREAVDRIAWHAAQGHAIVLVSGTLAPLARDAALALVVRLAVRGITASAAVCATRLEEMDGRWTGRVVGDAVFGQAKGRAVRQMARDKGFALAECYAYGDSASDRWMLEAVGRPAVVNPSRGMERIARRRGWAVLAWGEKQELTQSSQRAQRSQRSEELRPEKAG